MIQSLLRILFFADTLQIAEAEFINMITRIYDSAQDIMIR